MQTRDQDRRLLPLIWFAIVISLFIYAFLAWFVVRTQDPKATRPWQESFQQPVVMGLYVAGVAMFFASILVPKFIAARSAPSAQSPIRTALIMRWALAESIAIFGLVGTFLTRHMEVMIPLWVVSLCALIVSFPSEGLLARMEER